MMFRSRQEHRSFRRAPGYTVVFLRILVIVFVAEVAVMEILGLLPERFIGLPLVRSTLLPIADSVLLVALVAPALFKWAIKPYVDGRNAMAQLLLLCSHELRTPLNGITGLIDVAADAPNDPGVPGYLSAARGKARELTARLDQILNYSQLENGTLVADPAPRDVTECLRLPVEAARAAAVDKGLAFETDFSAIAADPIVWTDCGLLRLLIAHLLDNAIKFTASGGIRVSAEVETGNRTHLRIVIEDSGEGTGGTRLRDLAGAFIRRDMNHARSSAGLGLGLAISSQCARLLGCELDLLPRGDGGTRAILSVPRIGRTPAPKVHLPPQS